MYIDDIVLIAKVERLMNIGIEQLEQIKMEIKTETYEYLEVS